VRKLVALSAAATLALTVAAGSGATALAGGNAKLTTTEVPKLTVKTKAAKGSFAGKAKGYQLRFTLTFDKLTSPATRAFIGYGKKGKNGNVSLVLCSPCKSPVNTIANLNPSLTKALRQGLLYVEVDTKRNPQGELRGQL